MSSAVSKARVGEVLNANTATEAANAVLEGAIQLKNNRHKAELARVTLKPRSRRQLERRSQPTGSTRASSARPRR